MPSTQVSTTLTATKAWPRTVRVTVVAAAGAAVHATVIGISLPSGVTKHPSGVLSVVGVPPLQLGLAQESIVALIDPVVHVYLKDVVVELMHVPGPAGSQETRKRLCVVMGQVLGPPKVVATSPFGGPGEGNAPVTQV